jgi:hypothetical protein
VNYYEPLQRKTDQRWDFTKNVYPTGYCAGWREWKPLEIYDDAHNAHWKQEWETKILPHKDRYHSDGHATAEEAAECYKQYLLDRRLSLNRKSSNSMHKCKICGEFTQLFAELDLQLWHLCEAHNNRESIEKLFEAPGKIISSY